MAVDGDPPTFFFLPSPRVFLSRPFSSLVPRVFALRISSASVRPEGRGEGKGRGSSSMGDSSSELCSFLPFSVGREGGGGNPPVFPEWGSGSLFRQQPPPPLQGCIGRREEGPSILPWQTSFDSFPPQVGCDRIGLYARRKKVERERGEFPVNKRGGFLPFFPSTPFQQAAIVENGTANCPCVLSRRRYISTGPCHFSKGMPLVFSGTVLSLFLSFSFSKSHGWRGRPSILYPMSTASFLAQCVAFFFFGTQDKESPSVPPRTLIARVATVGQTIGLATTALAAQPLIERGIRQIDLFEKCLLLLHG